jgi:uncharacterized protein
MLKKFFDLEYFFEDFKKGASRYLVLGFLVLSVLFLCYAYLGKQAFLSKGGYGIPAALSGATERTALSEEIREIRQQVKQYDKDADGASEEEYASLKEQLAAREARRTELAKSAGMEQIELRNWQYIGWFFSGFFFLFLLPVLFIALHPGLRLKDYGLGIGDWRFGLRIFAVFSGLMIVLVLIISIFKIGGFLEYYPMFARSSQPYEGFLKWFIIVQFFYFLYFVGWEFFFRSLLLFPLEKHMGRLSALVAVLPFAIMHIGKPPAEAFGSIIAAYFLALLVLRTRSFWICAFIHFAVAFVMDLAAALSRGLFG